MTDQDKIEKARDAFEELIKFSMNASALRAHADKVALIRQALQSRRVTADAINDAEEGRVTKCKNVDELITSINSDQVAALTAPPVPQDIVIKSLSVKGGDEVVETIIPILNEARCNRSVTVGNRELANRIATALLTQGRDGE